MAHTFAIIASLVMLALAPLAAMEAPAAAEDWPRTSLCVYPFMGG